jgi:hypothetical protein
MIEDDMFAPMVIGRIIHEETLDRPLAGTPSRQRGYMYGSVAGTAAALLMIEAGDLETLKEQLMHMARIQAQWISEDFIACYPLNERDKDEARDLVRAGFLAARVDHFVDMETGEIRFDGPPATVDEKPADPDDFVGAVPA